LAFFNAQRVHIVHRKGAEVAVGKEPLSLYEYLLSASREGAHVEILNGPLGNPPPTFSKTVRSFQIENREVEATQACRDYFTIVAKLVDAFAKFYSNEAAT
jgi:hypothetical protein